VPEHRFIDPPPIEIVACVHVLQAQAAEELANAALALNMLPI